MDKIDLLMTSASRPNYLDITMYTLHKHLKNVDIRYILHEDIVKKEESHLLLRTVGESFDIIRVTNPAKRLFHAIREGLKLVESKYVLKWEDDWILLRDIDIGKIIKIFEKDNSVNQVMFNKQMNIGCGIHKEVNKGEVTLVPFYNEWGMGPGIWRTDYIREKWIDGMDIYAPDFGEVDIGSFWYGGLEERGYIHHIGMDSALGASIE